jgi:hypothetical protein
LLDGNEPSHKQDIEGIPIPLVVSGLDLLNAYCRLYPSFLSGYPSEWDYVLTLPIDYEYSPSSQAG